jgi:hypothetical protein
MNDRSHCPTDAQGNPQQYFSPVAPPEACQIHTVPEPSTPSLLIVAMLAVLAVRKWVRR